MHEKTEMNSQMKRAVKYCGGCNPRFDRSSVVHAIEDNIGERLFSPAENETYDEIYVVHGCTARCADISAYRADRFTGIDPDNYRSYL